MRVRKLEFGQAVTTLMQERGLSDRAVQYKTGVDRLTIADMRNGCITRLEHVEAFARGMGEDVNKWRVKAGYPAIISTEETRLRNGLQRALNVLTGGYIPNPHTHAVAEILRDTLKGEGSTNG